MTPIANAVPAQREAHARIQAARARMGYVSHPNLVARPVAPVELPAFEPEPMALPAPAEPDPPPPPRRDWLAIATAATDILYRAGPFSFTMLNGTEVEVPQGRIYASPANAARLVGIVARQFGLDTPIILGPARNVPVCIARHAVTAALYLLCPGISLPAMGRAIQKDHTSVLNALRRHAFGREYPAAAAAIRQTWRESIASPCNASPDNQTHAGEE